MKSLHSCFLGLALCVSPLVAEEIEPSAVEETFVINEQIGDIAISSFEEDLLGSDEEFESELLALGEAPTPIVDDELLIESSSPTALLNEEALDEPLLPAYESPGALVVKEPSLLGEPTHLSGSGITVDLKQAFNGSPVIYSILLGMSIFSVCLWLYALASVRVSVQVNRSLVNQLQHQLSGNQFAEALQLCSQERSLLGKMLSAGLVSRSYGMPVIIESMKSEAKRSSVFFWQKIGLLNDIAIIAPMLGLLGTVLGMFYAFYDVNRSIESISTLFDGLGISVGTTVAGLVVAILALILHSTAKYRLIRALAKVENQAQSMVVLFDDKTHIHRG